MPGYPPFRTRPLLNRAEDTGFQVLGPDTDFLGHGLGEIIP
jgi:hypothetical protein